MSEDGQIRYLKSEVAHLIKVNEALVEALKALQGPLDYLIRHRILPEELLDATDQLRAALELAEKGEK